MLSALLLALIYVSFISLGLPDSMLGAAWPMIFPDIGATYSQAGLVSMSVSFGTIISSLSFSTLAKRFSTAAITTLSILVTSLALFTISTVPSIYALIPISFVLGLGGGCVDSALNNYVALHYSSSAMSFLHGFWGIGTTVGPIILGVIIPMGMTWRSGYRTISAIQFSIFIISLISRPLWRVNGEENKSVAGGTASTVTRRDALSRRGAVTALLAFFAYCAAENTIMVWNGTYGVYKGLSEARAASCASLFFWGMTGGRMLTGLFSKKTGDTAMIRMGAGVLLVALPSLFFLPSRFYPVSLLLLGLGCAPFYPMMIHQTPRLVGAEASAALIGLEMAAAYTGSTLMPFLFGRISEYMTLSFLPFFLLFFFLLLFACTEKKRAILLSGGNR